MLKQLLRTLKFLITFTAVTSGMLIAVFSAVYLYFAHNLPNIQTLKDYKPPVVSEVFARDGTKIGEFWTECRFLVPIAVIPERIINAFIAAEDTRFFEHRGIDFFSIIRAMVENIKAGRIVQGGSTITQQITRSVLLSSERKMARKIREAILATRIERNLNKEQILELYLNQIFLGNRAYGIKAAARNYFHKDISELTIAETAMIAGMPTAPSQDSPVHDIAKAKERQEYVLGRLRDIDLIGKKEYEEAKKERLTIYIAGTDKEFNYQYAPYFVEHVRRIVREKYGDDTLYRKGLKIHSTADLRLNQAAQIAVRHGLEALDKRRGYRGILEHTNDIEGYVEKLHKKLLAEQTKGVINIPPKDETDGLILEPEKFYKAVVTDSSAGNMAVSVGRLKGALKSDFSARLFKRGDVVLVKLIEGSKFALAQAPLVEGALYSMNPFTGEVLAMAGGYDFKESEFNRATQAVRQPGSSFKPFVYSAALDKGFKFGTPILDSPVTYAQGPYLPTWTPKNYGGKYSGLTTFESNLIYSRNVPTVKIANDIGLHYLTAYARKIGIETPIDKFLSMALGANGVYLSDMVTAYSTFATLGVRPTSVVITKIEDADGTLLEETPLGKKAENKPELPPTANDLNTVLFEEAQKDISADQLILTQEEIKILYGSVIPEGHVITPQTAYLMTKLLQGVVERGTGTRARTLERPVAGKTGTTNDETDCWFIGFTPDIAAGAWVGFDNIAKIGYKETGGQTAAPIFIEYMKTALKDIPIKDFAVPEELKSSNAATLTGGSAIYFKGYSLLREGLDVGHGTADRAIDFFEEDMDVPEQKILRKNMKAGDVGEY